MMRWLGITAFFDSFAISARRLASPVVTAGSGDGHFWPPQRERMGRSAAPPLLAMRDTPHFSLPRAAPAENENILSTRGCYHAEAVYCYSSYVGKAMLSGCHDGAH